MTGLSRHLAHAGIVVGAVVAAALAAGLIGVFVWRQARARRDVQQVSSPGVSKARHMCTCPCVHEIAASPIALHCHSSPIATAQCLSHEYAQAGADDSTV